MISRRKLQRVEGTARQISATCVFVILCVCLSHVLGTYIPSHAKSTQTNAHIFAHAQKLPAMLLWVRRLLRLRGGGSTGDTEEAELYSWNGKLLQTVREAGEVVRVSDLQSRGAIIWERGKHSANTLEHILAKANRAEHVPSFLKTQVAPYIVPTGRAAGVKEEEVVVGGQQMWAKDHEKEAAAEEGGQRERKGDTKGEEEGNKTDVANKTEVALVDQPQPLAADEEEKVNSFLRQLIPGDIQSQMQTVLEHLKELNRKTYGNKLEEVLSAADKDYTQLPDMKATDQLLGRPPAPTTSTKSQPQQGGGLGAGGVSRSRGEEGSDGDGWKGWNLDAVRLAEALGVMQV